MGCVQRSCSNPVEDTAGSLLMTLVTESVATVLDESDALTAPGLLDMERI